MLQVVIHCLKENETDWQVLLANKQVHLFFANNKSYPLEAALYIDCLYNATNDFFEAITDTPVLVNAVIITGASLKENQIRFNGWPGFFEKKGIEIAGTKKQLELAVTTCNMLLLPFNISADTPGMLAARAVSMIINEAYFGWEEGISSKEDIDTAMKLGTNYPFGPFEWATKIGIQKIVELLQLLSKSDDRYVPAEALLFEMNKNSNL